MKLHEQLAQRQKKIKELEDQLQRQIDALKKKKKDKGEEYWDNRWKRARITYQVAPGETYDVRTVFSVDRKDEHELRNTARQWEKLEDDDKAEKIFEYVHARLKYISDDIQNRTPEYWQDPFTTYRKKRGDCEDGAILINKLWALARIPAWKRKLCAGWVKAGKNAPEGGHAYAIYYSEVQDNWFVADWCYFPNKARSAFLKIPHEQLQYYKKIWWTANEFNAWKQDDFVITDTIQG